MRTDRQADMTMLIVALRSFAEAPNYFLPLETTCLLPSSVGGHVTSVVCTFLALNVSQSQIGSPSVACCIGTNATLPSL
jgi:hypothetical protein